MISKFPGHPKIVRPHNNTPYGYPISTNSPHFHHKLETPHPLHGEAHLQATFIWNEEMQILKDVKKEIPK